MMHHRPHVTHTRHVPVVERLPVRQAQGGEVGVLLEEDEVPSEAELHRLSEQAAGEALRDAHEVAGLGDKLPDLTRLIAHHRDGVVGILE